MFAALSALLTRGAPSGDAAAHASPRNAAHRGMDDASAAGFAALLSGMLAPQAQPTASLPRALAFGAETAGDTDAAVLEDTESNASGGATPRFGADAERGAAASAVSVSSGPAVGAADAYGAAAYRAMAAAAPTGSGTTPRDPTPPPADTTPVRAAAAIAAAARAMEMPAASSAGAAAAAGTVHRTDTDRVAEYTRATAPAAAVTATSTSSAAAVDRVPGVATVGPGMNSAFTDRLQNVIRRMRDEYGHEVRVVEGWRSQERQNALFAQGRSAPGPVVTWTRNSQHTHGRAADVIIDGTYNNAVGYRRLARIAAEEGLRTLGARDPGHIELPGTRAGGHTHGPNDAPFFAAAGRPATGVAAGFAGNTIAPPATQAPVAHVAQVAHVARPAVPGNAPGFATPAAAGMAAGPTVAPAALAAARTRPEPRHTEDGEAAPRPAAGALAAARGDAPLAMETSAFTTASPVGSTAAARTAQVLDLLASRDAGPEHGMLLRLDDAGSAVRLGLRGRSVHAAFVTPQPELAHVLGRDLSQLREALAARGLDAERLSVRAAMPSAAAALRGDAAGELAGVLLARAAEPVSSGPSARGHADGDQPRRQPDPDPRSRREQQRKES